MDIHPRLLAAADMCEGGEQINLDEVAFLLRYAADELTDLPKIQHEHKQMKEALQRRLTARCDLLQRGEREKKRIDSGSVEELQALDEELDRGCASDFPCRQKRSRRARDHHLQSWRVTPADVPETGCQPVIM